jgi:pyruvate/2-oxoglutarate dehydrogenase complex dihydrolipoamide dehydrogenase (E3) component
MNNDDQALLSHVHPPDWINPPPQNPYDLVVLGAGTAGLVVAAGAAGLGIGLKIALVEKHWLGGDCLNFGCVPSKALIRAARVLGEMQRSPSLGITLATEPEIHFAAVMERMQKVRAEMSHQDSASRFQNLGVDVFFGSAHFLNNSADNAAIAVGETILPYKKAVIATGARAKAPDILGLAAAGFLTNETVFSLTQLPSRLALIGGGPIGCELAQTFQRLGSQIILFHSQDQLLNKEDRDAALIIQSIFSQAGIQLHLNTQIEQVEKIANGKVIYYRDQNQLKTITVDEILVGIGRAPNVEELNLEAVGVEYDQKIGVKVNDYLQTTNPKIYAAGDICLSQKFTHAADATARIVLKNMLFSPFNLGREKLSHLVIPRVTYTDPEIAQVGLSEAEAGQQKISIDIIKISLDIVDRAIIDGETEGFIKIVLAKGSDRILGATIVARSGGELISEITTAIATKMGLSKLAKIIHPYPTQSEMIKKAADAYRRTKLTPRTQTFLKFLTKFS